MEDLRESIEADYPAPSAQFPTEPDLVRRYSVARETVRKALDLLQREGWIMTIRGRGTFVCERLPHEPVQIRPGQQVRVRMPTVQEQDDLEIGEGVPVFEVHGPKPGQTALYAGDWATLSAPTDEPAASC